MDDLEFCESCQETHKKNKCSGDTYQDNYKDLIKLLQNPFQEFPKQYAKFSTALALFYTLKPIRACIVRQPRCENLECLSPSCLILSFFCSINELKNKKALKDSMLKLSKYIDSLVNSGIFIETALDAIQALIASKKHTSPCKKLDLKKFFKLKITETYKCACGQELNCKGSGNFINIDIDNKEDAITYSFFSYFKQKLGRTKYSICKSSTCVIKDAKKSMSLKFNPLYFLVKINWKIEPNHDSKSISLNFSSSDLFKVDTSELYNLIYIEVVSGETILGFYNISGIWHDLITKSCFSFLDLLAYIQQTDFKIDLLIYHKEKSLIKSEVKEITSPVTLLQSPKKPEAINTSLPNNLINFSEKVTLRPPIDQTSGNSVKAPLNSEHLSQDPQIETWICPSCLTKNNYNNLVCVSCSKNQPGKVGWYCKNCQLLNNDSDNVCIMCDFTSKNYNPSFYKTDFTKNLCDVCRVEIRNGVNCPNCQKLAPMRKSAKATRPSEFKEIKNFCTYCGGLANECKCRNSIAKKQGAYENRALSTKPDFYHHTKYNCKNCDISSIQLHCITCNLRIVGVKCSQCNQNNGYCEKCIKAYCKNCKNFNDCRCKKPNDKHSMYICQGCNIRPSKSEAVWCRKCNRKMGLTNLCENCMKRKDICDKCKKNR